MSEGSNLSMGLEAQSAASSASPAPESVPSGPAPVADKPAVTDGQAGAPDVAKDPAESGQGDKPPEQSGKTKEAKGVESQTPKPSWDNDTLKWMQSKGYNVASLNPSDQAHKLLVENARNAESLMTKTQMEAKSKEILEKSKVATESVATAEAPKSPLDVYQANFEAEVQYAMNLMGHTDVNEFAAAHPELADRFNRAYVIERQKAWEKTQSWNVEQQRIAQEKHDQRAQLENDYKQMGVTVKNHFEAAKAKNPAFEAVWRESGVEKVLDYLDKTHTLPKEFVLQNPETFQWFADAAAAIENRRHEGDRKKEWQQEYEKQALKAKAAILPSATNGNDVRSIGERQSAGGGYEQALQHSIIRKGK